MNATKTYHLPSDPDAYGSMATERDVREITRKWAQAIQRRFGVEVVIDPPNTLGGHRPLDDWEREIDDFLDEYGMGLMQGDYRIDRRGRLWTLAAVDRDDVS
jgi:hypothetical protein